MFIDIGNDKLIIEHKEIIRGEGKDRGYRDPFCQGVYFCRSDDLELDSSGNAQDIKIFCHGIAVDINRMGDLRDGISLGAPF